MTTPQSLNWLPEALRELESADLRRLRRTGSGIEGNVIDFGSNDYLGLAADPRLAQAAADAARSAGWGAGASPVVSGRTSLHAELERRLAEFEQTEAAMLFTSGFAANAGTLPALVGDGDQIFSDAKNHASLIDGCRLSRATVHVYPHNDLAALECQLQKASREGRRLIVTDGLFSMDGDFAPLGQLGDLAEQYQAMLLVDEAHATGVWGPGGRGSVARAEASHGRLESQVAVRVGTLSKALGSIGGFVTGCADLIDWLHNRARAYVFSTALPPPAAAAAIAALEIVANEPERRTAVTNKADWLRAELHSGGWSTGNSTSQILPVRVGDPVNALRLSAQLAEQGLFVPAIRPPSVPAGESLLRVSVSARHTEEDLHRLVDVLGQPLESAQAD